MAVVGAEKYLQKKEKAFTMRVEYVWTTKSNERATVVPDFGLVSTAVHKFRAS